MSCACETISFPRQGHTFQRGFRAGSNGFRAGPSRPGEAGREREREREREGEGGRERERERESDRVFLKCCGCYVIRKKKERKTAQKNVANIKQMRLFF